MVQSVDLKEIERKAWTSYFQDGLWDIFFGLLMLIMGIQSLIYNVWFTLFIAVAVLVFVLGKRLVTTPRIGHVKFAAARKVRQNKLMALVGISIFATCLLWLLAVLGLGLPKTASAPIVVILVALVFGLIAYYMDFRRLYAYGLLFAISMALVEVVDNPFASVAFIVSGGIALLIGLVVLIRFLRKYPVPKEVSSDDTP